MTAVVTPVAVTGIGLRTCLGDRQTTWERLLNGETGIQWHHPFPSLPALPLGLIGSVPTDFEALIPPLVAETLASAQISPSQENAETPWGVVVGSSRGCQRHWENWVSASNPHQSWWQTFPYQAANLVAHHLPSVDLVQAPMAACATGLWTISTGVSLIHQGRCQRVLAGAVEVPVTPLTLAGFERMGVVAPQGCFPFDQNRKGLVLAEGGAFFVLESLSSAQRRGATIYGVITGCGFTCDAFHRSTPNPDLSSAYRTVKTALAQANCLPDAVDCLHLHGTGTQLNDEREAKLVQSLFPHQPVILSTKGATGHTLGASGTIALALSLLTLQTGHIPPCVGLSNPAFSLNFAGNQWQPNSLQTGLIFSFGFGGQNAVLSVQGSKTEEGKPD